MDHNSGNPGMPRRRTGGRGKTAMLRPVGTPLPGETNSTPIFLTGGKRAFLRPVGTPLPGTIPTTPLSDYDRDSSTDRDTPEPDADDMDMDARDVLDHPGHKSSL